MSFSLSRLRRTLRSMSIGFSPIPDWPIPGWRCQVLAAGGRPPQVAITAAELHLDLPGPKVGVTDLVLCAVDVQGHAGRCGCDDPSFNSAGFSGAGLNWAGLRWAFTIAGWGRCVSRSGAKIFNVDADQAPPGPAPVTFLGQRTVHARRRDLERVAAWAHRVLAVDLGGDRAADPGDGVHVHAVIGVHHHA